MKRLILLCLFLCVFPWLINAQTGGETAIIVNGEGNVGINEPNPEKQFVVNGETEINGTTVVNGEARITTITVAGVTNAHIPSGMIVMWSGEVDEIPAGWVLCDGSPYTNASGVSVASPDLRGRFIVGYNSGSDDYGEMGATGGSDAVNLTINQLPEHNHSGVTADAGNHIHAYQDIFYSNDNGRVRVTDGLGVQDQTDRDNRGFEMKRETAIAGSHAHPFTTNSIGKDQAHENRPAYFVLAFIIKQ